MIIVKKIFQQHTEAVSFQSHILRVGFPSDNLEWKKVYTLKLEKFIIMSSP